MQNTPFNGARRRPAPHPLLATFPSPKSNIFIYLFYPLCVGYVYDYVLQGYVNIQRK
jgi:hypothetical protein